MSSPIVITNYGKLQGSLSKTESGKQYCAFKGIPYAKPPLGNLRFSIPEPPEPWDGIRDATKECNVCSQLDRSINSLIGSEDCLYLNVYTTRMPDSEDKSPLPVMVFIHGGGFVYGQGTDDKTHGPDYLIEHDVVIVSINYRLGILGFLCLDCKDAPGNMGLRDQVMALKWVQGNIAGFGGDPKNVTIFGISAGGASIQYLMLSPMATGLYHKAIAQSGSALLHWAQNKDVRRIAFKIPDLQSKIVTEDYQLLKYLKEMPISDLISLSVKVIVSESSPGGLYFGFVPTVEKSGDWEPFLNEDPYKLLTEGKFNKVPYISGICSREGMLMLAMSKSKLDQLEKEKNFLDFLPFEIHDTCKLYFDSRFKEAYSNEHGKFDDEYSRSIDFFSDVDFFGGGYVSALLMGKHISESYFYEFAYDGALNYLKKKLNITCKGACHGDDGGYIVRSSMFNDTTLTDLDRRVSKQMTEMWTNFAKYGHPTPKLNELITTKWEPIGSSGISFLHIDNKLTMKSDSELYPERAKLYVELFKKCNC